MDPFLLALTVEVEPCEEIFFSTVQCCQWKENCKNSFRKN